MLLFSFLCHHDQKIKWRAVTAMGMVISNLAEKEMESARVIMRRLMWSLNDESGGIGWGAPEAMAEIIACHQGLAEEYTHILISLPYLKSKDATVRGLAARAMGLLGTKADRLPCT